MKNWADRHVLIVDDFETIRFLLKRTLHGLGFKHVDEASDGQQALIKLREKDGLYSIVITDWMMPNMTGFELLTYCRQTTDLNKIPIVMLTVESEMQHIVAALKAGANGYIVKPFDQASLEYKLTSIFNGLDKQHPKSAA